MKKSVKMMSALVVAVLVCALLTAPALAATTQDGLTAEILTDKETYLSNETIGVTIKVHNTNDFPMDSVRLTGALPNGLTLTSGQLSKETPRINAGEIMEISITANITGNPGDTGDNTPDGGGLTDETERDNGQPDNPANDQTDDQTEEVNQGNPPLDNSNTPNLVDGTERENGQTDNQAKKENPVNQPIHMPNTGDSGGLWIYITLIIGCSFSLVTLFIKGNLKKAKKIISIVLCAVLSVSVVTGILVLNARAVDDLKSFDITKTILVGGKTYTLSAKVEYTKDNSDESGTVETDFQKRQKIVSEIQKIRNSFIKTGIPALDRPQIEKIHDKIIEYLESKISSGEILDYEEYKEFIFIKHLDGSTDSMSLDFSGKTLSGVSESDLLFRNNNQYVLNNIDNFTDKKKIAIFEPYKSTRINTMVFDAIANNITSNNADFVFVANLDDEAASIEAYKELDKYNIIIINTHGCCDSDGNASFGTGTPVTPKNDCKYKEDLDKGRLYRDIPNGKEEYGNYFVTSAFFQYYYDPDDYDNAIFYLGCCHGADNNVLANILLSKGVKVFFSYSNAVSAEYDRNMAQTIFDEMSKSTETQTITAYMALGIAKEKHGELDPTFSNWYNYITFNYKEETDRAELRLIGDWDFSLNSPTNKDYGHLEGGVVEDLIDHEVLPNSQVQVYSEIDELVTTKTTDENGEFSLRLTEGKYTVIITNTVTDYIYHPYTFEIDIIAGETTYLTEPIYLQRVNTDGHQTGDDGTTNWDFIVPVTHQKTVPDGYIGIYSAYDLNNIRNSMSDYYILMNDIDLSSWENWKPVGDTSTPFNGEFDGNGYAVKNMTIYIDDSENDNIHAGLFGYTGKGQIKNLCVRNSSINIESLNSIVYVGGIAGLSNLNIDNCFYFGQIDVYCSNSMAGNFAYAGGIAGQFSTIINNCYNVGEINVTAFNSSAGAGGIAGNQGDQSSRISSCYNKGKISVQASSLAYGGGIIGQGSTYSIEISRTYNSGDITVSSLAETAYAGGIIGYNTFNTDTQNSYPATINNSYNLGEIADDEFSNSSMIGGIAGFHTSYYVSNIENCYNVGIINANTNSHAGGFVGYSDYGSSQAMNCYYIDNIDIGLGYGNRLDNARVLTTQQMQEQSSFEGFDFGMVWAITPNINNGYPYLRVFLQ